MRLLLTLTLFMCSACEPKPRRDDLELVEPQPGEALETFGLSESTKNMFKRQGVARVQKELNARIPEIMKTLEEDPHDGGSAQKNTPPETLALTGTLDQNTQRALGAFQKSQGLPETGAPDYETLDRLGFEPSDVFHHRPPANRAKRDENRNPRSDLHGSSVLLSG